MTIQDELDREFRRMSKLFDIFPDAVLFVSKKGLITKVNNAAEIFFGYDRSEMLGQPLTILIPEALRAAHDSHLARYFDDPQTRDMGLDLNIVAQKKDGTTCPVTIKLAPLPEEAVAVVRRKRE